MASIISAGTTSGTALNMAGDTSGVLQLATNGSTTAITIDTSQNVGIGTTSPTAKLDVVGIISSSGGNYSVDTSSVNPQIFRAGAGGLYLAARSDFSPKSIVFITNASERMQINSAGALILVGSTAQKATGTTWSNPSDQRLKDNIRDYTKGTTELMQVRVREWEYNGKGGTTEGLKGLGVVADEVMTVLPNTVETYDAKLNADDEENTEIKKFDATEITWLLVKTVQEQQTLITSLTERITALESK